MVQPGWPAAGGPADTFEISSPRLGAAHPDPVGDVADNGMQCGRGQRYLQGPARCRAATAVVTAADSRSLPRIEYRNGVPAEGNGDLDHHHDGDAVDDAVEGFAVDVV